MLPVEYLRNSNRYPSSVFNVCNDKSHAIPTGSTTVLSFVSVQRYCSPRNDEISNLATSSVVNYIILRVTSNELIRGFEPTPEPILLEDLITWTKIRSSRFPDRIFYVNTQISTTKNSVPMCHLLFYH